MKVLRRAGGLAVEKGEHARAEDLIVQARSLAEEEGDEIQVLRAMEVAALNAAAKGDLDLARVQLAALRERANTIGDRPGVARADVSLSDVCRQSGDLDAALDYVEEAVELFRELGNHYGLGLALGNSGDLALRRSDLPCAEVFFREACNVFGRIGAIHLVVEWCVPGLAAALLARQADFAAQLLGAAASLREELGIGFTEDYARQLHDRAAAEAKAALGDEAFHAAWARGESMTAAEIVTFAQAR
jgi:tetratricopeptide (TPR) repeat protein